MSSRQIEIRGARTHNLRGVDVDLPHRQLIAFCGVSGSGKTSLALDTLYAEGQRRYIESFSLYTRQFLERLEKPPVDRIDHLPAAISVATDGHTRSSRQTIATATETADYLRLLFARAADLTCPTCAAVVQRFSPASVASLLKRLPQGLKLQIAFRPNFGESSAQEAAPPVDLQQQLEGFRSQGFIRAIVAEKTWDVTQPAQLAAAVAAGSIASLSRSHQSQPLLIVIDRLTADFSPTSAANDKRLQDSLETAFRQAGNCYVLVSLPEPDRLPENFPAQQSLVIDDRPWTAIGFSSQLRCLVCGQEFLPPEPRLFSFNSPLGACPHCEGFGNLPELDWDRIFPDRTKSLRDGAIAPWNTPSNRPEQDALLTVAPKLSLSVDLPVEQFTEPQWQVLKEGSVEHGFAGLSEFFAAMDRQTAKQPTRVLSSRWKSSRVCDACHGSRLRTESLAWKLAAQNIAQLSALSIDAAAHFLTTLPLADERKLGCQSLIAQVQTRLEFLRQVGLGYLPLDRTLRTLSGGEAQRVALTSALGSNLVNMLYVLDEPSAGLHPRDVEQLVAALLRLRDRGNTVVVVEHEETLLQAADWLVEIGPGAGDRGGNVVFSGNLPALLSSPQSSTGDFLAGRRGVSLPEQRRQAKHGWIKLIGARGNNLKNITVDFPLGVLCAVTGVSGAGKTSLVQETLYGALCRRKRKEPGPTLPYDDVVGDGQIDEVILVDQSPVGRSARSNPVTYLKAFDPIRAVFAESIDARTHNYTAGHFSFNVEGGRCPECEGDGHRQVDMQFLADVYVKCAACQGSRYRKEILKVTYRGKNIAEVLELTVREAFAFFRGQPKVQARLKPLLDVGLDYLRLGQPAGTLSAGEAQRLKLAAHLSEATKNRTLFILDEPTTGLHFADVVTLLDCFEALLSVGHSLIMVEHNLQLIRAADYVIDLGPEAGAGGGQVVAQGTPEQIAACAASQTGRFLAASLTSQEQP